MVKKTDQPLNLKIVEALSKDMGRAYARMDPEDLAKIGANIGDVVEVIGKRKPFARPCPLTRT